ncbi:MAG: IS66 family insertion sequence element accessory protein TnpB [Paucibacter sp.]|nr:IS66 family insertion sequence element accessory protein TnpB [Roseateles sp.]
MAHRVKEYWLVCEPLELRDEGGATQALVSARFGHAQPDCAYLFGDQLANEVAMVLVEDAGLSITLRRLGSIGFKLPQGGDTYKLTQAQFDALMQGQTWQAPRRVEFWTTM